MRVATTKMGTPAYHLAKVFPKLHGMNEIGDAGGARDLSPLGCIAMQYIFFEDVNVTLSKCNFHRILLVCG